MTPAAADPPAHRPAGDRIASVVMSALAALAAAVALLISPFFVMATDACGHTDCRDSLVTWAYVVTWGGVALAAVIAVVGMITAARRRTVMWVWPALALFVVAVTFGIGTLLASSAAPGG